MKTKTLLFASLLGVICASNAQIYKWTDNQGNVHFTDTPREGSVKVDLPDVQSFSAPTTAPETKVESPPESRVEKTEHVYTEVSITQPLNQATIRNNQGGIEISAKVKPDLMQGDLGQLLFDGVALGKPQPSLLFILNGINRGSHTLAVQILDEQGNVLNTSDSITVYMHRPRVNMVPRGGN